MQAFWTTLALPPTSLLLLTMVALVLRWRRLALGLLALLWLLSTPAVVRPMVRAYAQLLPPPDLLAAATPWSGRSDAVVLVLGAGVRSGLHASGGYDLKPRTAERLRRGLWWSQRLHLPLAFSGGVGSRAEPGTPTEARLAAATLSELGQAPALWLDDQSADTRGNARYSARQLSAFGHTRVLLVSDALHLPRALHHLRQAAPNVQWLGAPVDTLPPIGSRLLDWLPSESGLDESRYLAYELMARIVGH